MTLKPGDESSCTGTKPEAPKKVCDCHDEYLRKKAKKIKEELVVPDLVKVITAFGVFFLLILIFDLIRVVYYSCFTRKAQELIEDKDFD